MTFNKEKIIIRPEKLSEYEKVDKLIYKAFAEQHSIETGKFMMQHFREERKKDTFIPELSLVAVLENGTIVGSIIIDKVQPIEYATIPWKEKLSEDEVMVIHLLMVRPSMSGKGIASSLIKFATELAQKNSCRALRLDTGSQNIPALSLYQKNGFEIIASASKKVGDVIAHKNHLFLEKIL